MAKVTKDEIKKLSALCSIPVGEEVMDELVKDMDEILGYVSKLNEVDASGIAEVHGGTTEGEPREDVVKVQPPAVREALIQALPAHEADLAKVPPVFTRST